MIDSLVKNNVYVDPTLSIYEAMLKNSSSSNDKNIWSKILQLTKKMYDRGVNLLSGTDIPNFNLVQEKAFIMNLNCFQMQVYQHQVLFKLLQKRCSIYGNFKFYWNN